MVNKLGSWFPHLIGFLKFSVDRVRLQENSLNWAVFYIIHSNNGKVLFLCFSHVGIKDSNKAEDLAILEALRICSSLLTERSIVEIDFLNAILGVSNSKVGPWKFYFPLMRLDHPLLW